jgi:hypothetical protein
MAKQHPIMTSSRRWNSLPRSLHILVKQNIYHHSLKPKLHPSSRQNVVLDSSRDSTLILHDTSLKKENRCAMDNLEAPTLELKRIIPLTSMKVSLLRPLVFHAHSWSL